VPQGATTTSASRVRLQGTLAPANTTGSPSGDIG
jgi:hypothetical protein